MCPAVANPRHLYVHIPFCPRVCPYCCFHVVPVNKRQMQRFTGNLLEEFKVIGDGSAWDTVYLGGGTPTVLPVESLERLLGTILGGERECEVTVECNPGTLSPRKAATLVTGGVNRFSIGIQSFDPSVLARLGRGHSVAAARQCVDIARTAGCANLNVDIMFGVPGQTLESWRETLRNAVALGPEHVSCYALTYEEDTEFFRRHQRGELASDREMEAQMYRMAREELGAAGYLHYEVSNYARPGFECRHNQAYWRGADYRGIGPGAVSTVGGERRRNGRMDEDGNWTLEETEPLDLKTRAAERMALGLRTSEGVDETSFANDFGYSPFDHWQKEIRMLTQGDPPLAVVEGDETGKRHLHLNEEGLVVADEIATWFV
jgi:oxygen-independent coproporphyrinogen-3 oxidase